MNEKKTSRAEKTALSNARDRPSGPAEETEAAEASGALESQETACPGKLPENRIVLCREMAIPEAERAMEILRRALGSGNSVEIDGSCVERIDVCGLQAILSSFMTAEEQGVSMRLVAASESLSRAMETAGLNSLFPEVFSGKETTA